MIVELFILALCFVAFFAAGRVTAPLPPKHECPTDPVRPFFVAGRNFVDTELGEDWHPLPLPHADGFLFVHRRDLPEGYSYRILPIRRGERKNATIHRMQRQRSSH